MNDWLSEIEAWEEREKDEDIRRMARVIREFEAFIKWKFPDLQIAEFVWGDPERTWSDDVKELLK